MNAATATLKICLKKVFRNLMKSRAGEAGFDMTIAFFYSSHQVCA
jgi:hypothetical protein